VNKQIVRIPTISVILLHSKCINLQTKKHLL